MDMVDYSWVSIANLEGELFHAAQPKRHHHKRSHMRALGTHSHPDLLFSCRVKDGSLHKTGEVLLNFR